MANVGGPQSTTENAIKMAVSMSTSTASSRGITFNLLARSSSDFVARGRQRKGESLEHQKRGIQEPKREKSTLQGSTAVDKRRIARR